MARLSDLLPIMAAQFILLILLSFFAILLVSGETQEFVRTLDRKLYGLKKEKLSHFRVYWHDIYSGSKPTAVSIIQPAANASNFFGFMSMIDDPLTEGPELSTKLLGRAQGLYAQASQEEAGLLMAMNFVFLEGKYNGSTITILGRNQVFSKVREMPVVGGSGLFRFARGYVHASTYKYDPKSGDAVVEYNVYVMHY